MVNHTNETHLRSCPGWENPTSKFQTAQSSMTYNTTSELTCNYNPLPIRSPWISPYPPQPLFSFLFFFFIYFFLPSLSVTRLKSLNLNLLVRGGSVWIQSSTAPNLKHDDEPLLHCKISFLSLTNPNSHKGLFGFKKSIFKSSKEPHPKKSK